LCSFFEIRGYTVQSTPERLLCHQISSTDVMSNSLLKKKDLMKTTMFISRSLSLWQEVTEVVALGILVVRDKVKTKSRPLALYFAMFAFIRRDVVVGSTDKAVIYRAIGCKAVQCSRDSGSGFDSFSGSPQFGTGSGCSHHSGSSSRFAKAETGGRC
jgi:hypothetical protein